MPVRPRSRLVRYPRMLGEPFDSLVLTLVSDAACQLAVHVQCPRQLAQARAQSSSHCEVSTGGSKVVAS